MKRLFLKFAIIILSICVIGIVCESLIRLFYEPIPFYDYNSMVVNKYFSGKINYTPKNNNLGFREEELPYNVFQDNYKRILFLGDSFTEGHGIEKGENRFSDIIENRLNMSLQTNGFKYHIYNAGKSATEPEDWIHFLDTLLPIYKPQYVFAVFFLRDGTDLCTSLICHEKEIKSIYAKYENKSWYKYTDVGKHIGNFMAKREFTSIYKKKIKSYYLGSKEERGTWIKQQIYLLEINNICKKNNVEFHLIIFPLLYDLESKYQFYDVENEISNFAGNNDISTFSLINGFIGQKSKSLWVSIKDQHPNEKGHLVAANTLYPYLKEIIINTSVSPPTR